ncbi:MAG: hypothetical protein IPP65_07660 [Chlorobi bacterium]|nr:hypothetical protein [Chlorobiota bacterium]
MTNGNFVTDTAYRIDTYSPFIIAFDNSGKTIWNKFITNCQNISITTNGVELISAFDFNKTIHFDNRTIVPNTSNLPNLDTSSDICISVINPNDGITKSVYKYGDKGSENFPSILFNKGYLYLFANLIEVIKNKNDSSRAEFGSFLAKIKLPTLSVNLEDKNNLQVLESVSFIKIKMPIKPYKSLLSCFNSIGEKLFTKDILPLTEFVELDKLSLINGKYFCTIEHYGITETISFVIQK